MNNPREAKWLHDQLYMYMSFYMLKPLNQSLWYMIHLTDPNLRYRHKLFHITQWRRFVSFSIIVARKNVHIWDSDPLYDISAHNNHLRGSYPVMDSCVASNRPAFWIVRALLSGPKISVPSFVQVVHIIWYVTYDI